MATAYEKIRAVKEKNVDTLLKKQNVVGVGIGKKIKDGELTQEDCLRVYVEEKLAKSQVKSKDLVDAEIGDIKTDVIGVGKIRFQQCNQRTRKRPAFGGDSCGSCRSTTYGYIMAGTLGCVVVDRTDGKRCILSNNHVLADYDSDTDNRAAVEDIIVQPGTLDGGTCATDADRIAMLKRWIPFISAGDNLVDAAIGEIINNGDVSDEIGCDIGRVRGVRELTPDDVDVLEVQKCGRTTCYTTGTVTDIDVTVNVGYEVAGTVRTYRFIHQIFLTNMSTIGDSGSLILNMEERAIGLLFAGSATVTVANPIQTVLDELNIEFPPSIVHCRIGGPDRVLHCVPGGPDRMIHCKTGGPNIPLCVTGGPEITCRTGGPEPGVVCRIGGPNMVELCRIGGPTARHCLIGGPEITCRTGGPELDVVCRIGGPRIPMCLACGPDSPIGCGNGGPDRLIDLRGCNTGPGFELDFVRTIMDPKKILVLDLNKIPKAMQKSMLAMLKEIEKEK